MRELEPPSAPGRDRSLLLVAALALLLWLGFTLPLTTGSRTLYMRDVFTTHLPAKAFGAAQLRHGSIPAFDPNWGLGMPFRGNPGILPLYPGNLLYLVLPFWIAFNLHFALHWLLAALGMALLARRLGQSGAGALVAALTYAGSGWMFSLLSFANILAVAAWWPFGLAGAVQGGRRGIALGGSACGLALLGGEPITTTLSLVPLLVVAWIRHGFRRGIFTCFLTGLLGLVVALPQIVASARIVSFSIRGAVGDFSEPGLFHLGGARFLELFSPFPFGIPGLLHGDAYRAWNGQQGLPYVFTIYFGIVALWLALLAVRRHRVYGGVAAAGLLLAWIGGLGGDLLVRLSGGVARYPEKLIVWPALLLPLLAGWGIEIAVRSGRWRGAALGAAGLTVGALAIVAAEHPLARWLADDRLRLDAGEQGPSVRILAWIFALLYGAAVLALAGLAVRRGSRAGVACAQLLALLPLARLAPTAPVAEFSPSGWAERFPAGTQLVTSDVAARRGPGNTLGEENFPRYVDLFRAEALDLGPIVGCSRGWGYPLASDLVGLHSPLTDFVVFNLSNLKDKQVGGWMRVYGVSAMVATYFMTTPDLRAVATQERFGGGSVLYSVRDPAPSAWWPRSGIPTSNPMAAFSAVSRAADPVADVVLSRPVRHQPGGRVRLLRDTPDEIEVEVESSGGILAVRRTYQPIYRAEADGVELRTQPINVSLLGVEVPAGRHRVRIFVSSLPEKLAGIVAFAALVAALAVAWRARPAL